MDIEKIGKFLKALRKERNLTQDQLAEILSFDRSVISKWECGRKLPTVENFNALSQYYDISINELIYGERMNKENAKAIKSIPIRVMSEGQRKIHMLHVAILTTFLIGVFSVLIVYFVSNYNSIKIYRVGGSNENYVIKNTLMIISKHRSYLNFGEIDVIGNDDENISYGNYELYVKKGDTKIILSNREDGDLVEGLEKIDNYLNFSNLNKFINNIYIDIYDDNDNIVTIKLDATLEMTNNKIFNINDDDASNIKNARNLSRDNANLPEFVRKNFKYNEEKDIYTYSKVVDGEKVVYTYDDKTKLLYIIISDIKYSLSTDNNNLSIRIGEDINSNILYDINEKTCLVGNCEKYLIDQFKKLYEF